MILAVIGFSQREYDWKIKALKEILRQHEGVNLPLNQSTSVASVLMLGARC